MDDPISTSVYSTDILTALPGVLKREGYSTAFYHGGTNGTMSFDIFCANAGFEKYYGRTEYGNEKDYDGNWGIWDGPFLQYFVKGLSVMKQPFMASVFTVTSHEPYNLPDQYTDSLPEGPLPICKCIGYTDRALKNFFAVASRQPWFNNTLFIITPDHCSPLTNPTSHNMDNYAIPILYYAPGDTTLKGYNNTLTQQIDIVPSALDYLGYSKPFFAFGNSIFRNVSNRYTINYLTNTYQLVRDGYLLQSVNTQPTGLYLFPADSAYKNNLLAENQEQAGKQLAVLKIYLQLYHSALIHNTMWVKEDKK